MDYVKMMTDDLFSVKGVLGALVVTSGRKVMFQDLTRLKLDDLKETDIGMLFLLFDRVDEADLLFEYYRIYIRKCPLGVLWVIMQPDASAAMIRLQCDILIPKMTPKKEKKIDHLFNKRN